MSISRALTARNKWNNSDNEIRTMPNLLTKASLRSLDRTKISAPVLLATTNVDTFNAPSVEAARQLRKVASISSNSSGNSDNHSDASSTSPRSRSTSVTDSSSIGSSPSSPKPAQYDSSFNSIKSSSPSSPPPRRAVSSADLKRRALSFEQPPLPPPRAPSHSKVAHEQLARKQSLQQMNTWQEPARSVPPPSPSMRELRASKDMFNHKIDTHVHPFGKELEQLDEIAEEFGGAVRDAEREADINVMRQKRLAKFSAAEYIMDIQPLFNHFFSSMRPGANLPRQPAQGWI